MKTDQIVFNHLMAVCDAELTSDYVVYTRLESLAQHHKKYDGLFTAYILPKIIGIAVGDNLFGQHGIHKFQCRCIAKELSALFVRKYKEDQCVKK